MIGFDARAAFVDPHRGFGRVTKALAGALLRQNPGEIVVFVPHGAHVPKEWYPLAAGIVQLRRPGRAAFLADPLAWRWSLGRTGVSLLHLPAWGIPPGMTRPVVATFHDATPLRFPSPRSRWQRFRARLGIRSLTRATLVHAVSHYAANELAEHVKVPPEKVRVVHWGVGPPFQQGRVPVPPRHLLFVGGCEPHKNLDVVVRALVGEPLAPLVVVGAATSDPHAAALLAPLVRDGRATVLTTVSDDALAALYRGAFATLVPSHNEGFGLPALEAMACGCPVIASNCGALPEICGGAALLVGPHDASLWREAMSAVQANSDRRAAMIAAGLARAASLTWDHCAAGMSGLYREAIRFASS